ncbi:MAG: methyltransferase [Candidatus Helarchaeota archaeon]
MKNNIDLSNIQISFDETYHIYKGAPLYSKKFKKVMSFHPPGLAAVEDESGAYHINIDGKPAYKNRFLKTFGFYEGIATVVDDKGWFHINIKGEPLYNKRFSWAGNFQEGRCAVRDFDGLYFHINSNGFPSYNTKYKYVGDYKYGIAVVYDELGFAKHINKNGKMIHYEKFIELGVFHKGFAIAKDENGYFHINKYGKPLYSHRFAFVEPFYNGQALVRNKYGETFIINEKGEIIHYILDENSLSIQNKIRNELMDDLVGYWSTQIIYSISKLEILEKIKNGINTFQALLEILNIPKYPLDLIIKYLKIHNFITELDNKYYLRYKGMLLTPDHPESLKFASLLWGSEHYLAMSKLLESLKSGAPQFDKLYGMNIFQFYNDNPDKGIIFNKAMKEYGIDYDSVIDALELQNVESIMDIGGGIGTLLSKILHKYPNIKKGILIDLPNVINDAKKFLRNLKIFNKIQLIPANFFQKIPVSSDAIILSRVLHDWNDHNALKILKNAHDALNDQGTLFIIETIIPKNLDKDIGISLNFNLLVMTGGKERTLDEYENLLKMADFKISKIKKTHSILSIIIAKKYIQPYV